jgi:MOSC domain-containing protein YiiM
VPFRLVSINVSMAEPLVVRDGRTVMSGIRKRVAEGAVAVGSLGLQGDEQADAKVHGGFSKALYAYPHEHYPFWQTVRAQMGAAAWGEPLAPGALGENLTLSGVSENDVWVGDLLRFPGCTLAVSQPRYPCFKLEAVMGFAQAGKAMIAQGWCGFYLAVREPGTLEAGQAFELVPGPRQIAIAELFHARKGR